MGSPNARARMQQIEEEIASAKIETRKIYERKSEIDDTIRELKTRYLGDLRAESHALFLKYLDMDEKIEALELELSRLKSQ